MVRVKHSCSPSLPFSGQSTDVPLVVIGHCGEQRDRKRMKVELLQNFVNKVWLFGVLVDPVEGIVCGLHRQRWDVKSLEVWRDGGDAGGDTNADVLEPSQFLHRGIDLLSVRALRVENGFGIVEDYEHPLGG